MTGTIKRANARELEGYDVEKGTIRFPLDGRIPVGLIKRLVKARVAEMKMTKKR
jgi:uncharacterized protein YdhG (YjbR/CyaY superfamily)